MSPYWFKFLLIVPALAVLVDAQAQEQSESGFGVEVNLLAGKVVKHSAKFTAPVPALSSALDVNLVWKTNGTKDWQYRRKFPQIGVGATFTDYGNDRVFGKCLGVYPNLQIPIVSRDKWEWTTRLGLGAGYVTRKFQYEAPEDTINTAIGTHVNAFAIFMMDVRHHLNDHWQLQYGLNFTHISNGGTIQPNLGINMVGGHAGVLYYPGTYRPKPIKREVCTLSNRWLFSARMNISYKQARAAGRPVLPTYMPSVFVSRRWRCKNKYFFGVDYAFHNDVLAFMRYYDVFSDYQKQRRGSWDGYVFAGNEFLVGRLGILAQVGVNYKNTFLKFDPVCQKIGGHFYLIQQEKGPVKEVFLSAILLTHGAVAELIEFGVGASF